MDADDHKDEGSRDRTPPNGGSENPTQDGPRRGNEIFAFSRFPGYRRTSTPRSPANGSVAPEVVDPLKGTRTAAAVPGSPLTGAAAPRAGRDGQTDQDSNVDNVDKDAPLQARPPQVGFRRPGTTGNQTHPAPNVDNVDKQSGRDPGREASPSSEGEATRTAADSSPNVDNVVNRRPSSFARPYGMQPSRPLQRPAPNVDIVVEPVVPEEPRPLQDLSSSMAVELDHLSAFDAFPAVRPVRNDGDLIPSVPTRLEEPTARTRYPDQRGPTGPSRDSVDAVRRAVEERKAARVKLRDRATAEGVDPAAGSTDSRISVSSQARKGTTVTQATLDQYLRRGQLLFSRYRRELSIEAGPDEISPVEFVQWAMSLKPMLSSGTWRMYRQCLYHYLGGYPSHEIERASALLDADVIERSRPEAQPSPRKDKADRKTSALKEKRFPLEDYQRVQIYLQTFNRSRMAPVLADWLRAGILTGLRPTEWQATDLETRDDPDALYGRRVFLYVLNAKATNGRGTGLVRTLDLSAFLDEDIAVVRRMVDRAREWLEAGRYSEVQGQCSGLLYAAIEKIWPARRYHYSLYSSRHQAISNWKAKPLTPAEIGAIVGHGVTSTAASHYGKRRTSWPAEHVPAPPSAVPEELAVVRDVLRLFERRMQLEVRAGLRKEGDVPEFPVG